MAKTANKENNFWYVGTDVEVLDDERLSSEEKLLFCVLCRYSNKKDKNHEIRECFPSVKLLARKVACSERKIQQAMNRLEELGLVKRTPRYENNRQKSNKYRVIGCEADCYQKRGAGRSPLPPNQVHPENDSHKNDIYIPKGESESPSQDSQDSQKPVEENNVMSHQNHQGQHDSDQQKKTQLDKAKVLEVSPEACDEEKFKPEDAPYAMKPTAELFLIKTGRAGLTNADISAFRELNGLHTPARIQTEIYTQLKKFAAKGRPASSLNMPYIASVLRKQKPTFKPLSPGDDKTPEELAAIEKACRDLNACVITTPDDMTEEEAIAMMERTDALLREMGEL